MLNLKLVKKFQMLEKIRFFGAARFKFLEQVPFNGYGSFIFIKLAWTSLMHLMIHNYTLDY